jgi:hypothetical protein
MTYALITLRSRFSVTAIKNEQKQKDLLPVDYSVSSAAESS